MQSNVPCAITSEGPCPKATVTPVPSCARSARHCSARSYTRVLKYTCGIAGFQLLRGKLELGNFHALKDFADR